MDRAKIQRIKFIIAMIVVAIVGVILIISSVKYNKEGEKNMPFNLSKIIIASSAKLEELPVNEGEVKPVWNYNIIQNNDIYVAVEKNENYKKKNLKIKSITIDNISIIEGPNVGSLKAYMPSSVEGDKFQYTDDFLIQDSLTYRGASQNDYKNLLVADNGGNIAFSLANKEVGIYTSNENDDELIFNAKALQKIEKGNEDVKSKISFNIIIELENRKKYSGNVVVDINCENLTEEGTVITEITDFSNVIFKKV